MLAIAVGALVAVSVAWYATSSRTASVVNAPAFERSVPDSTTGQKSHEHAWSRSTIPNSTGPDDDASALIRFS